MKVFLSYTRADAEVMEVLAGDIRQLAHTVWYDREVAGGQAWWSAILREIRESDLFVLILTSNSLDSEACRAEFTYASQLGKPILPLLCDAEVNVNLLPPELSQIQFVNCCAQDKQAAFGLFRALQALPKAGPPPEKLPAEPPVPISYLGGLQAQVDARDHELTLAEQSALFIQIKGGLNAADSRDGAMTLLRRLRDRQDLRAKIADEIDAILEQTQPPQESERKRAPARKPAPKKAPADEARRETTETGSDSSEVLEDIQQLLKDCADSSLFVGKAIPPDKLANAIGAYAPHVLPEDVLLLFDKTFFGGAKDGLLLTGDAIYWHNLGGKPGQFNYADIQSVLVHANAAGTNFAPKISINQEEIELYLVDKRAEALANVIRYLAELPP